MTGFRRVLFRSIARAIYRVCRWIVPWWKERRGEWLRVIVGKTFLFFLLCSIYVLITAIGSFIIILVQPCLVFLLIVQHNFQHQQRICCLYLGAGCLYCFFVVLMCIFCLNIFLFISYLLKLKWFKPTLKILALLSSDISRFEINYAKLFFLQITKYLGFRINRAWLFVFCFSKRSD